MRQNPVALRKESVDRNAYILGIPKVSVLSLSARRAWIEIDMSAAWNRFTQSLSARRAWIEIRRFLASLSAVVSRSPQGERG